MSGDEENNGLSAFQAAIKSNLGPIAHLLDDETVSEVLINGPNEIFVERGGKMIATDAKFSDEDALRAAINAIAQSVGRRISDEEPRLDARLPDGSRIHAVLPPMSRKGTTVAIRKFFKSEMTFKKYIELGAITIEGAQFLDAAMRLGKNILVSGGTGSGKTTLLGLLTSRIPPGQRIIVIEDSSELKVEYEHVVFFETRMSNELGEGEVSIRDLVVSSLRLRPDRIIVGEVRAAEALELIQAMNTGHKGCMGTVHANAASESLTRLQALAQSGDAKISEAALLMQISTAVDMIVQVSRYSDGSRRIASITEVLGLDDKGNYDFMDVFRMSRMLKQPDGSLKGRLEPVNVPTFMSEIEDNGIPFSRTLFNKKAA
jgi:pilus assembly protein CpaF